MDPQLVAFRARDGVLVPARLYTPEMVGKTRDPGKPAAIFIHGAGYLQNAHRYWSVYYREYMFHHLLAERGYVVLDLDYRGSAGYGRDWRTAIYAPHGRQGPGGRARRRRLARLRRTASIPRASASTAAATAGS